VEKKIYKQIKRASNLNFSSTGAAYYALSDNILFTMNHYQPVREFLKEVVYNMQISLSLFIDKKKEWCS